MEKTSESIACPTLPSAMQMQSVILIDALNFARDVLVLKNLKDPGPISGGIPSQRFQMLNQRSTSPPSSQTHAPIFYKFSLTPQPGCHGQSLEH
jgi:hypothetical protein